MIVSAGFTAPLDGKKLPSTTYRFSTSCARQFSSSALVRGSREVPDACFERRAVDGPVLFDNTAGSQTGK